MHKSKIILLVVFLTLTVFKGFSQGSLRGSNNEVILQKFDTLITTRISLNNYVEYFQTEINGDQIDIVPNTRTFTNFAIAYRFLYGAFSISPDWLPGNGDNDLKGNTRYVNYGFGFNLDHLMQHFSFSYTRGFYSKYQGDYFKFPDHIHRVYQGRTGYKFNKHFSIAAITSMAERQNKSAGSFIPMLHYKYYTFDDQTPMDRVISTSQRTDNLRIDLQIGYFHTFIIGKYFFIAPGAAFGGGYLHTRLLTRNTNGDKIRSRQNNPLIQAEAQLAMGYNSNRFFAGIQFNSTVSQYKQENSNITTANNSLYVNLTMGFRLVAPKIVVETVKLLPYAPGN